MNSFQIDHYEKVISNDYLLFPYFIKQDKNNFSKKIENIFKDNEGTFLKNINVVDIDINLSELSEINFIIIDSINKYIFDLEEMDDVCSLPIDNNYLKSNKILAQTKQLQMRRSSYLVSLKESIENKKQSKF
jgi:hypothetical protein